MALPAEQTSSAPSSAQTAALFSAAERGLLERVGQELTKLDSYAKESLSGRFERIVERFARAGSHDLRLDDGAQIAELSLRIQFDTRDPFGAEFPEVLLQCRKRSHSALLRKTRRWFGRVPHARVLVLTPLGYRSTLLRNLDAKRFLQSKRPRLAPYQPSSAGVLSRHFDTIFGVLLRPE